MPFKTHNNEARPTRRYRVSVYEVAPAGEVDAERFTHVMDAVSPWDALLRAAEPVQREMDGE